MIIEFKGIKGNASISGYMRLEDADDERPLCFYNNEGFEIGSQYPNNPFPEVYDGKMVKNFEDYEILKEEMQCDDLLIQYLIDFADEKTEINRGQYVLCIN